MHLLPSSVVRHKVGASVGCSLNPRVGRASALNQYVVLGKDLPGILMPVIPFFWAWYSFRSVPMRPSKWHLIPLTWREFRDGFAVQREGYSLGRANRREVWALRKVSMLEILRSLFWGTGRA